MRKSNRQMYTAVCIALTRNIFTKCKKWQQQQHSNSSSNSTMFKVTVYAHNTAPFWSPVFVCLVHMMMMMTTYRKQRRTKLFFIIMLSVKCIARGTQKSVLPLNFTIILLFVFFLHSQQVSKSGGFRSEQTICMSSCGKWNKAKVKWKTTSFQLTK